MNWTTLEFEQLTVRELYLIMRARSAVFVVERTCVHLDADGHDEAALHLFGHEDMSRPMPVLAYARIRAGDEEQQEVVVDKVLISPARRGDGTADALFERVMREIEARWPGHAVRVVASQRLAACCERLGFRSTRARCDERGASCAAFVREARCGRADAVRSRRMRRGVQRAQLAELR